jgi:hypothetical protein
MKNITGKFKIDFYKSEKINSNYSQASQDIFVLMCLDGKENGTFLDLGCHHPTSINNTYLLESELNWDGVSIDIDSSMINLYGARKTKALNLDCTNLNFDDIMKLYTSNHIDYLSLDLEPAEITLRALENIPFNRIEFSVITYEHDRYRFNDLYRDKSRNLLENFGYKRICSDVKLDNSEFEDWYYNPKYVSYDRIKSLESQSLDWSNIIYL